MFLSYVFKLDILCRDLFNLQYEIAQQYKYIQRRYFYVK